jgi:carboxyl-terminal processing protease
MDAVDRSDGVAIKFEADGIDTPPSAEIRPVVAALPRPVFKYSYQIVDDKGGNGDGRIQRGEPVSVHLTVKNVGAGPSHETQANMVNASGDGLLLKAGRFDISNMKVGEVRRVSFTFDVSKTLAEPEAVVTLSVGDRDLNEVAKEKLKIPIEPPATVAAIDETRTPSKDGALLLEAPKDGSRAFGRVASTTPVAVVGRVGGFDKVKLDGDRFAFVASTDLVAAAGKKAALPLAFEDVYSHAPPELKIEAAELATRAQSVKIAGTATASTKIQDLYGFVGNRKVFYKSNKAGADPKSATFEIEVPLKPGVNVINVVARENADSVTRRMLVVRRDAESGAIMRTPKAENMEDWFATPPDD